MKITALVTGGILAATGIATLPSRAGSVQGLAYMAAGAAYKATKVAFIGSVAALTIKAINDRPAATAA